MSLLAPVVAFVLYPKANWLFGFSVIGVALLWLQIATSKDPSPQEIADLAERLVSGNAAGWDVDDYEYLKPKHPALNGLWRSTMMIGGAPEMWPCLDETTKSELRAVISTLRNMETGNGES